MKLLLASAFCLTLLAASAWPQASTSTVRGTVTDQTHAVIPGAAVTLTNTATNVSRSTQTNEAGLYVFPGVTPGNYRIVVESPGLQRFEGTLTVQVQQDAVVDVTLRVAQTVAEIQVADVTPLLQLSRPSLGQVLERTRIEQLPINGRGYQALLITVPGIDATGRIRAYGLAPGTHTLLFDGTQMNEVWEGWDIGRPPGLDAIQEFRVELNSSSAKFSRPTTIVLSSRSGTNQFRGSVFWTNRNSGYGVARQRQDTYRKPPYLNRNEYGASGGGPILIPGLYNGRDRTFFFFAWEGNRILQYSTQQWTVPTEAMRRGDFRGLVDALGRQIRLYDPFTTDPVTWRRQPLSYRGIENMIDPARISPMAKYLFSITPLPTLPEINPLLDNNWVGPVPRVTRSYTTSLRIDHRFSERDLIYGRYTRGALYESYQYPTQPMLNGVSGVTTRDWPNQGLALTWVRTFSPTLVNELTLTGTRDWQFRGTVGDGKTDFAALMGVPNPFKAVNFPTVNVGGLGNYGFGGDGIFYLITNFATLQNNTTKLVGKHELQFGYHYRFEDIPKSSNSLAGAYGADTMATALYDPASTPASPQATPLTGFNLANLFLGVMNYNAQFMRHWWYFRRHEHALYFQDDWKVTPRLTLNLGVRYEYRTPIFLRDGSAVGFSFEHRAYVLGTDLDRFIRMGGTLPSIVRAVERFGGKFIDHKQAGLPRDLVRNLNWKNLGPRLGFAYRALDGHRAFVLRGGYRLCYYTQPFAIFVGHQNWTTPVAQGFQYSVTNTALSPDGLPNYGLRSVPQYIAGVNTPDSIIDINDTRLMTRGFWARFVDPDYRDPLVHDWNLTLEKEVMANTVVRASYVGNHSRGIEQLVNYNEATPAYIWYETRREPLPTGEFANVATRPWDQQVYGTVVGYMRTGWSNYQGLEFELERRYHNGLGFQVFWNIGNTLAATATVPGENTFLPGRVPSDFKERNRFLNYARDPVSPKHRIRWNWLADLPFGRGKLIGRNTSSALDKFIGGWQIASTGYWRTNYFSLPTTWWPTGEKVQIYGYKYPIEDCTAGICFPGYLWWNGYIPANRINSRDAQGRPNGIMGVPADYKPAVAPLIPYGTTALPPNAPANTNIASFWDSNTVWIPLKNGTIQRTTFNDNLNPFRNQFFPSANQWGMDASLFKFIPLSEGVTLRINVDFFNVLNHPNNPTSVAVTGVLSTRNSGTAARTTQFSLRLSW